MAIRDTVARLISDVYAGKRHPRIAAGLAPLMHLQLRVLEKTEFEKRPGQGGAAVARVDDREIEGRLVANHAI